MDIGKKAKNLFNELIEISFNLLYLLKTPNGIKRDYQNNSMKPLTNNSMKPIPSVKPFLGIKGESLPIDMSNYAYHPGYMSSSDDEPKDYD